MPAGLTLAASPFDQFQEWMAEAEKAEPKDPNAMIVATATPDGRPSARAILLKGVDDRGFVFYTNLESRKGREALEHPAVALCFWWPPLEAQIRFEGRAERVPEDEADAYFATRPRGSQLGAWASHQSQPLASREEIEARLAELTERFEGMPVPRPPHWSGLRVRPLAVEFWKNRPNRLHQRELYTRQKPGAPWFMTLLNP
jgi:pyridoxamine 5'-phosphate oxidase